MSELIITDNPAQEVGDYINNIIQEHVGDVVCLLGGGSALDIVEYIHPGKVCYHQNCVEKSELEQLKNTLCDISECRTIFMMGDERVSGESDINNFLQLKTRYKGSRILGKIIPTVPEPGETENEFADRIEKIFSETLLTLTNPKIIFILGVGTDGHTAGIFPLDEVAFRETYRDDLIYVPVHLGGLKIDSRASFTPSWILGHTNEVIGYITGETKKSILIDLSNNDKKLNERPAEILKLHKKAQIFTDIDLAPEEPPEEV